MRNLQVKTGRNDLCPCGSGKKYKHCCLTTLAEPQQPGLAQSILDEITEAAAEQPVSTLDELNAFASQVMNQRNRSALAEFSGLTPDQMSSMLYAPFTSPETVCFSTGMRQVTNTGVMRLFIALVEAIGESGLKATATGNLPLKFCKALAQQLREEKDENNTRLLLIGGIRSEKDLEVLHCTRLVAQLAGLIRKYRGKFVLTRKCRDMLAGEDYGSLYFELFKAYSTKFNWGYRDGYSEAKIVQLSFLYTLFLLVKYGDVFRSQKFYEDKFLAAFPMALEMFPETSYSSAEEGARRCYFLRSLDRFAIFFGLAELKPESQEFFRRSYVIGKSALLDRFVSFW
jgi:hypothetical protein